MPPESPSRESESDVSAASAASADDALRAAVGADAAGEARFWRARAEELAAQVQTLQAKILALSAVLPVRHAALLTRAPEDLRREPEWPDPLAGWKETTSLERASVATELPRLWARLADPTAR